MAISGRRVGIGLLLLAADPASAPAGDIGIDARHGWSERFVLATGEAFDGFRDALREDGHRIVPIDSFEPRRLAELEALVLLQAYTQNEAPYSPSDIEAIEKLVLRGGGLLALGEAGSGSDATVLNWNLLAATFGVAYSPLPAEPAGLTIGSLVPHPITEGVETIGVDYVRRLVAIAPPAADLTFGPPRHDLLAAIGDAGPGGRVVLIGDSGLFMDDEARTDRSLSFADNRRLLRNVIAFLLEPPHVRARAGNVEAALGPPADVLFVNDSSGGAERIVRIATWEPLDVFVAAPPTAVGRAPFALYAWTEPPEPETLTELPLGIGFSCRRTPLSGPDPALRVTWNNLGRQRRLGAPRLDSEPAPSLVLTDRNGTRRPLGIFLQGLIVDAFAPSGRIAVTNGIELKVE